MIHFTLKSFIFWLCPPRKSKTKTSPLCSPDHVSNLYFVVKRFRFRGEVTESRLETGMSTPGLERLVRLKN